MCGSRRTASSGTWTSRCGRKAHHRVHSLHEQEGGLRLCGSTSFDERRKLDLQGGKFARDMTMGEAFDRYMNLKGRFSGSADDVERELNWILDQVVMIFGLPTSTICCWKSWWPRSGF